MANIRANDLPEDTSPSASDVAIVDGATTRKTTLTNLVNAARPFASQVEAEAGTATDKAMNPLAAKQAITAIGGGLFATASQGALAASAVQPGDLGAVATSNEYGDLNNLPTLGTAAATDTTDYAPAAQAVPIGGTTGQVLGKVSDTDNDVAWTAAGAGDLISTNNLSDVTDASAALSNLGGVAASQIGTGSDLSVDPAKLLKRGDAADAIEAAVPIAFGGTKADIRAADWARYTLFVLYENDRYRNFKKDTSDLSATLLGPAVASSAVDTTGDEVTTLADHGLVTGDAVVATAPGDDLSTNTLYYAIRTSDTAYQIATSFENAHAGTFIDLTGTSAITVKKHFDPLQALYITPDTDITGASGALVALDMTDWVVEWWGISTGHNDCSAFLHPMITAANEFGPKKIRWQFNQYRIEHRLPEFGGFVLEMEGYGQGFTAVIKAYAETDDDRGMLHFTTHAPLLRGFNFSVDGVDSTGGRLVTIKLPGNDALNGRAHLQDCIFAGFATTSGVVGALLTDGVAFDTGGMGGPRNGFFSNCYIYGGTGYALECRGIRHSIFGNCFVTAASAAGESGGSTGAIKITGDSTVTSDDNIIGGVINGDIYIEYANDTNVDAKVNGDVEFASTASNCWVYRKHTGTLVNNGTSCGVRGATAEPGAFTSLTATDGMGSYSFAGVADDTAVSMGVPTHSFMVVISCDSGPTATGSPQVIFPVRYNVSSTGTPLHLGLSTAVAFATGVLSGTTGTDGNVTISMDGTGQRLYIENRFGSARSFRVTFLG